MNKHDLYELCVQSPGELVPLLQAIHGADPKVLGEDFCGTAAVSRFWVERIDGGRAIAVDHDGEPLTRVATADRIEVIQGDVVRDTSPRRHRVDVLYAGNFSIGECHDRPGLLAYLRHARSRLRDGGVFVCDLYGGETAFLTGSTDREHQASGERTVRYTWEQRCVDPLTGAVVNAMHFQVRREGRVEAELRDAFVYRWRLRGLAELRDATIEAGFVRTEVYGKVPDAVDDEGYAYTHPLTDAGELQDSFDVLIAGRR